MAQETRGQEMATLEKSEQERIERRQGMQIDWDSPVAMDDGLVLRAS
jgi:hypothetical protein